MNIKFFSVAIALVIILSVVSLYCDKSNNDKKAISPSELTFNKIIKKAKANNWHKLPIGKRMGFIANELIGTPYVGFTLEGEPEKCTVDLNALDCVTFFENVLGMARIIKDKKYTYQDLINEVTFTRYRNGKLTDYTSRLHYTADWIHDNARKSVVSDISKKIGGVIFQFKLDYMSTHPDKYEALKNHPEYVKIIAKIENDINKRKYYYIPKDKIESIEDKLQTGDIIAFATSMKGLDYTHTGMVVVDKGGIAHLMHASSTQKKVVFDKSIHEYIANISKDIGISVLRPLE